MYEQKQKIKKKNQKTNKRKAQARKKLK